MDFAYWWSFIGKGLLLSCSLCSRLVFDRIWIQNIIRFSEITKYRILMTIRYWQNPNTEHYLVPRKSEYWIWIVLLGLTIQIPNTKYPILNEFFEKMKLKLRYLFHTQHLVLKLCETIWTGIYSNFSNTRILFGVPKNPNTVDYSVLRKSEYQIQILLFSPNILIIQIPNYSSHPVAIMWQIYERVILF